MRKNRRLHARQVISRGDALSLVSGPSVDFSIQSLHRRLLFLASYIAHVSVLAPLWFQEASDGTSIVLHHASSASFLLILRLWTANMSAENRTSLVIIIKNKPTAKNKFGY